MLRLFVWSATLLAGPNALSEVARGTAGAGSRVAGEEGQTTAEYALVLLAAAAVAFVLIAWARSSGRLPAFFDSIIDNITGSV